MARVTTYSAAILNIRIVDEKLRDYTGLLRTISKLKRGVKVRGNTGVAITVFNPEENRGQISKYTEIPLDSDWFNTETFAQAVDTDLNDVSLPEHLKPGLENFSFRLNPENDLLTFLVKASEGKSISPRSILKYFETVVLYQEIRGKYGEIVVTLVQDPHNIASFFKGGALREIEIVLKAPNDGIDEELRAAIGEKLTANNAAEIRERLKAKRGQTLTLTDEYQSLALLGGVMGKTTAIKEVDGIPKKVSSESSIEIESSKFDPERGDFAALDQLRRKLENTAESLKELRNPDEV